MLAFVLSFALVGQTPASVKTSAAIEIPFRAIGFGSNSKIKDGGAIVIRSDKALDVYRNSMGTTESRKPTVDWAKEEIVALHAEGTGYGGVALQVNKVKLNADGTLSIEVFLDQEGQPAIPTPGVVRVLRREGIYALVVVAKSKGAVTLQLVAPPKIVAPPRGPSGKSGSGE